MNYIIDGNSTQTDSQTDRQTDRQAPVGNHTAMALSLQTTRRFTDLLAGIERDAKANETISVVDGLTVDTRLLIGYQHLLLLISLIGPQT